MLARLASAALFAFVRWVFASARTQKRPPADRDREPGERQQRGGSGTVPAPSDGSDYSRISAALRPSARPGHVCGVSRTLPRPLPRALALGLRARLATARAYRYASLALGSYVLPPARVSRQGPPRNLAQLAEASGGGCGARRLAPSRRLLDADWRAALRRSAEASGACIRHARIAFDSGSGRRAPADTRKEPT